MRKVFVYGSLKEGYWNHVCIKGSKRISNATTEEAIYDMRDSGYPLLFEGGEDIVSGEVYEVDDATLERCDRLEGHPNFYKRTPVSVVLTSGEVMDVEMYITQGPPRLLKIPPIDGVLTWSG